jgi:hypothetical protein
MIETTLKQRWGILDGRKNDIHERNEKYARWTLPYLYPEDGQKHEELDTDLDSTGADGVNHLSNKLIETLYPSYRPFLKLEMDPDIAEELERESAGQLSKANITKTLARGESQVLRDLSELGHRSQATLCAKYLVVTGNALIYYPDKGKCQVFNTRDYCVVRDLSGTVIEILVRSTKAFETFAEDVQAKLRASKDKKYEDGTDVTVYTQIKYTDDKYRIKQSAEDIELNTPDNFYAKDDLPWIVLTWNLVTGEDYGRGLVEDFRGAFKAVEVLSKSLAEGVISAATIKYLVSPASLVDVEELNNSPNGSYHVGRDGDVVSIKSDKHLDLQQVQLSLDMYQRQLGKAFLLNSAVTRDAERVTTLEIRDNAQELEISFGGIYSRFTEDWQKPVANLMLKRQDLAVDGDVIYPTIVTGFDTLSRLGELDNYRLFMQDLQVIGSIAPDVLQYFDVSNLLMWLGTQRGLDYTNFLKTPQQVQQAQEAARQAQEQQMMAQAGANTMQAMGTELIKE